MDKWGKATVSAVALLTANPELHRACVPGWITCVPKKYLARHSARFLSPGLGADAELCAKINAPSLKGCSDGPPQHPVIVLAGSRSRRFRGLPVGGRQQRHELSEVYTSAVERFAQEVMRWGIRAPRTSAWQFVAPKSLLPTKIFQLCSAPACRRWLVKKKAGDWESGDMVLFRRCGRCRYAQYCSSECQLQHWVMPGGHRGCC